MMVRARSRRGAHAWRQATATLLLFMGGTGSALIAPRPDVTARLVAPAATTSRLAIAAAVHARQGAARLPVSAISPCSAAGRVGDALPMAPGTTIAATDTATTVVDSPTPTAAPPTNTTTATAICTPITQSLTVATGTATDTATATATEAAMPLPSPQQTRTATDTPPASSTAFTVTPLATPLPSTATNTTAPPTGTTMAASVIAMSTPPRTAIGTQTALAPVDVGSPTIPPTATPHAQRTILPRPTTVAAASTPVARAGSGRQPPPIVVVPRGILASNGTVAVAFSAPPNSPVTITITLSHVVAGAPRGASARGRRSNGRTGAHARRGSVAAAALFYAGPASTVGEAVSAVHAPGGPSAFQTPPAQLDGADARGRRRGYDSTTVLFRITVPARANSHGQVRARIHIAYSVRRRVEALLTVTVRSRRGASSRTIRVIVAPDAHYQHQRPPVAHYQH